MFNDKDIDIVTSVLKELKDCGKVLIAVLYGSFAKGVTHKRSDIDLALYETSTDP